MLLGHQTACFYHFAEFVAFSLPPPPAPRIKWKLIGNDMKHLCFFYLFFIGEKHWKNRLHAQVVGS